MWGPADDDFVKQQILWAQFVGAQCGGTRRMEAGKRASVRAVVAAVAV
jgi:hypothetical protein